MEFSPETIFISYSRTDGRDFAEAFERRLEQEGIRSWRDLKSMEAGDIRPQVLRAIEDAKHLVLILSRRALTSEWIKREWSHTRMVGKRVSPVLADPTLRRADLPPWMRREEVFDIDPERDRDAERWKALVLVLRGDGRTKRAPYMPGDLPDDFVPRPAEYEKVKQAVLSAGSGATVAVTTALLGAGGYGKTTLANRLCRDPDVRFEFSDGVLRVEIGKERDNVTGLVIDLIEKLDPNAKRPGFQDIQTASEHLGELIGEARLLLVIDDVWREAQLRPFLKGGPNCVRLVTTRLPQVLPHSHVPIAIDEMRADEALSLIVGNLPGADQLAVRGRLTALVDRLGFWAQMLSIANGWIRSRIAAGENLADAIFRFERRLETRGLTAFDPKDEGQRNRAISACVEASLEDLEEAELARLGDLAILPEEENVPLGVVEGLWAESGSLDEEQADDLFRRFHGLSLLQSLDLGARTMRLHDNMLWYLRDRIGPEGGRAAHQAMVRALTVPCAGKWETLPAYHAYGWRFLIRHLRGAGLSTEAERLLTDYIWIRAMFHATGPWNLFASYLPRCHDEGAQLVGRAIALSLPALAANPRELPRQLYGRLGSVEHSNVRSLVDAAQKDADFRPAPRWPGLTLPGAERLRLVGHEGEATSVAFSPDCARIVTASYDGTARIWEAATGKEITTLRGHESWVTSAAFSPDGARVVTASADSTARIWDAKKGAEINVLREQEGFVTSAVFSPDGFCILIASDGGTARIWEVATSREIVRLRGHVSEVRSAAYSPDGTHIVTASHDGTARIWDAATGREITALHGHGGWVTSAAFSPDGARIVTASQDCTARIWDVATGSEITVLGAHMDSVTSAVFSPDGSHIATAYSDRVAIWDAMTGQMITTLLGHESWVASIAFSPDGTLIASVSKDHTARVWNMASGSEVTALAGRTERGSLWGIAFSSDGARIATASSDGTAGIWDATTGRKINQLVGHEGMLWSVAFSSNGSRIVTASSDCTARIWDAAAGKEITALRGHTGWVESTSFSPNGGQVLTASQDGTVRLWDTATGREITVLPRHNDWVRSAAFSPDGARIVTASGDTAAIWNATGSKITVVSDQGLLWAVAFSPDGASFVTASSNGTARIWDAAKGSAITALCGHTDAVRAAVFSPDGTRVVTASWDRTARIWEVATGEEIARFALDAAINALAICEGAVALGDAVGRVHVFEAEEFLYGYL